MIDVNEVKVGDKLKILCACLRRDQPSDIVEVVDYELPGEFWLDSGFAELSWVKEFAKDFDLVEEFVEETKPQKIKVLTADHEYQGLYRGSIHTITNIIGDVVEFKLHGKTWTLVGEEYELYEDPLILDAKSDLALDKQETPKKATEFLSKALSLLEERGKDYDQPEGERSMGKTVVAFNAITGHNLKESDGWLILQLLKDVRQNQNRESYHADSAEDCISYAALKAEALAEGK